VAKQDVPAFFFFGQWAAFADLAPTRGPINLGPVAKRNGPSTKRTPTKRRPPSRSRRGNPNEAIF